MATRKTVSKTATRTVKKVAKKVTAAKAYRGTAAQSQQSCCKVQWHTKVVLAGLGAAKKAWVKPSRFGAIAHETERLTQLTNETAQNLLGKANVFMKEGQRSNRSCKKQAEAKAMEVVKEVKAFAAKQQKAFKKNVTSTINAAMRMPRKASLASSKVFEARVAKTLNTFGIPSAQNVRELQTRMGELQKALTQAQQARRPRVIEWFFREFRGRIAMKKTMGHTDGGPIVAFEKKNEETASWPA